MGTKSSRFHPVTHYRAWRDVVFGTSRRHTRRRRCRRIAAESVDRRRSTPHAIVPTAFADRCHAWPRGRARPLSGQPRRPDQPRFRSRRRRSECRRSRCRAARSRTDPVPDYACACSSRGCRARAMSACVWRAGDIVGFPDDDCWYDVDTVARVLRFFAGQPSAHGLSGGGAAGAGGAPRATFCARRAVDFRRRARGRRECRARYSCGGS